MAGLLEGVRVLDLTNVLAGPFCGYQLALQGAEVIKVEIPGSGDLARQLGASAPLNACNMGASFLAQNANKKSITLNLKNTQAREAFLRLVETADVVLENFRPGVMQRMSLGYEELRAANPGIVYCAISGFGQDGPLSDNPAYDQIIQGLSGLMSLTGEPNAEPYRVGYPICDTLGGLTAAFAICAALTRRGGEGEGAFIDVSLLDATLVSLGWPLSNLLIADVEPQRLGNDNATASPSGAFRTGRGMLNIAANKQDQFLSLCGVLGIPELALDERFAGREARKQHRSALTAILEDALLTDTAENWAAALNAAGVPAGCVLDLADAVRQPQVVHRRIVETIAVDGEPAALRLLRAGFQVAGEPAEISAPPPRLGEHTHEILLALGYEESEIGRLHEAGAL